MLELLTVPFFTRFAWPQGGFLGRMKRHLAEVDAAHAAVRTLAELPADASRDTGLGADELAGLPARQDALPFFLQSGFGQNRAR